MTDPTCRCNRPIHDTAYVCTACAAQLRRHLGDVARIAGDITLTVAKLGKVSRRAAEREAEHGWYRGDGALYPMPLIVDLDAAARHDAAAGEIVTWARHMLEQRGIGVPEGHPLAAAAQIVSEGADWLRYRQEAQEAWPALLSACWTLQRVIDTAPHEAIVGRCPCGRWLYAAQGSETVRCWGCGTGYDVASSRAGLRDDLEDRAMTGAEIATMAGYLGIADRTKARLMIKVWAQRGKLEPVDDGPRYRFGDALPLLLVAYARAA